jgi:hypothetical protein
MTRKREPLYIDESLFYAYLSQLFVRYVPSVKEKNWKA